MTFDKSTTTLGVISSWLTPMMFFVALNLMIVTIFLKFSFGKTEHQKSDSDHVPSVLRKLKSVNNLFRFPSFNLSHVRETASYEADEHDPEDLVELVISASSRSAFRQFREAEVMETTHLQTNQTTSFEESVQLPMMSEKVETLHLSQTDENDYETEDRFEAETNSSNNMSMNEIFSLLQRQGSAEINDRIWDTPLELKGPADNGESSSRDKCWEQDHNHTDPSTKRKGTRVRGKPYWNEDYVS